MKHAGIVSRHKSVRSVCWHSVRLIRSTVRLERVIPVLGKVGVGKAAVGRRAACRRWPHRRCFSKMPAAPMNSCKPEPGGPRCDWHCKRLGRRGVKFVVLVAEPVAQPQHREVEVRRRRSYKSPSLYGWAVHPAVVKCNRAAQTLNDLQAVCRNDGRQHAAGSGAGLELPPVEVAQIARAAGEFQVKIMNARSIGYAGAES